MKQLVDTYGRKIDYLRISVIDRCNLHCVYCMPVDGFKHLPGQAILSYEEILTVVKVAVSCGINKFRVTGGEPLLRKNIVHFIRELTRIDGVKDVSLTTNGILLADYAEQLKSAGLTRINVSLDSLNPDKYKSITGSDILTRIWAGIEKSITLGFNPVKINVVVIKGVNDDEITELAKLTYTYPVQVRFIELMPVGCTNYWTRDRFVSSQETKVQCEKIDSMNKLTDIRTGSTTTDFQFPRAKGIISFISPLSAPFCSQCSRLRLTADGKLRQCLGSANEIDLKPIIRNNKFSSIQLGEMFTQAVSSKPRSYEFKVTDLNPTNFTPSYTSMCQLGG